MAGTARFIVGKYDNTTIYNLRWRSLNTIWTRKGRDFYPHEMETVADSACEMLAAELVRDVRIINGGKVHNPCRVLDWEHDLKTKRLPRERVSLLAEKLSGTGLLVA